MFKVPETTSEIQNCCQTIYLDKRKPGKFPAKENAKLE
jgi:hypothetical protein